VWDGGGKSFQIPEDKRELLYEMITTAPGCLPSNVSARFHASPPSFLLHTGVRWAASVVDHTVIDDVNILQATLKAMTESVEKVRSQITGRCHVAIDGNKIPAALQGREELSVEAVDFPP
jgi:ribonuclease HII